MSRAAPLCGILTAALLGAGCASTLDFLDERATRASETTERAAGSARRAGEGAVSRLRELASPELVRVRPWERDLLARPEMSFSGPALVDARRAHVYFSKEASLAGASGGGGGCGCN